MQNCILASNNAKKIEELRHILQQFDIDAIPQAQLNIGEIEETGKTFVENALIKARHAAQLGGKAAIADDSGICVPALGGAPGIYSARYSGVHGYDNKNNEKLLAELAKHSDRRAYYVCVIVYLQHPDDPLPLIAQGLWHGSILHEAQGHGGFGYDPLFYLPEQQCSVAELSATEKNRISHRAKALQQLQQLLQKQYTA